MVIPAAGQDTPPPPAAPTVPDELPPPPPPVLTNTGKPMVVPFQCATEDLQAAGFSCTEDAPCNVYLELSAATSAGNHFFVSGNIHSEAVTLYSVLLGSDDAGKSWMEVAKRIRASGLEHLEFLDASTGWAGGQQLFPLPQEPFVLGTTDGGKTWRQQAVYNESVENHFGSIQEMHFASKTNGSVVIDRSRGGDAGPFALYESSDGGDTWELKEQNSSQMHIKGAVPQDADWRVRVDPSSKAFQVEHRQGERWSSNASFAVNLGACKIGPR